MTQIFVTKAHRGKLTGLSSINTTIHDNKFCQLMKCDNKLICSECYGYKMESYFPDSSERWKENFQLLTNTLVPYEKLPTFKKNRPIRFHSFGELENKTHLENFVNITFKNPSFDFALWTKRKDLVKKHYDILNSASNLMLVYSAPKINVTPNPMKDKVLQLFNIIFTVFDEDYAEENDVDINCSKRCLPCLLCYRKTSDEIIFINELLKSKS